MFLYPEYYFKNIQSVDLKKLHEKKIKGIILDVDNTLIDYKQKMPNRSNRMGELSKRKRL